MYIEFTATSQCIRCQNYVSFTLKLNPISKIISFEREISTSTINVDIGDEIDHLQSHKDFLQ